MSELLRLHDQDLVDIMVELDRSNSPRARILHDLADSGHVYSLDEKELGPLRKAGTVFHRSEWASPILNDQLPFENLPNTKQIKGVLIKEVTGDAIHCFSPTLGSLEKDARALVGLLTNIGNPHYSKPGSIRGMHSPTIEDLCTHKADWALDGMLGASQVTVAVTPADDVQDMEYFEYYILSTLLTGTKVWFVYPPIQDNLAALQNEHRAMLTKTELFAMDHAATFQHGIALIQRAGEAVILPPFWTATSISTQASVSSSYRISTAMVFPDRIKHIADFLVNHQLWYVGSDQGQRRLIVFATEFVQHLQMVLADSFPHFSASKVVSEICREYELLCINLRRTLDSIEDKAVVRGLENMFRAAWLNFLEQKRKKTSACRLCKLRIENMPMGGAPTDRLRQHFVNSHCLRNERSMTQGKGKQAGVLSHA